MRLIYSGKNSSFDIEMYIHNLLGFFRFSLGNISKQNEAAKKRAKVNEPFLTEPASR